MPKGSRGGRGGGGGGGGGGESIYVKNQTDLVSRRETEQKLVDDTLRPAQYVYDEYGVVVNDFQVNELGGKGSRTTMAYHDSDGNIAFNKLYWNEQKINGAYDDGVLAGFHPPRGNKSGTEATAAHELGHALNRAAALRSGGTMEGAANDIVTAAARKMGVRYTDVAKRISGYAKKNAKETIAEAFADVYCNGKNAQAASKAVMSELNAYFGK